MGITLADALGIEVPLWQDQAECQFYSPDLWIPTGKRGNYNIPRKICNTCPVKKQCLDWVKDLERSTSVPGMYGGMTQGERLKERLCSFADCSETIKGGKGNNNRDKYCSPECVLKQKAATNKITNQSEHMRHDYYMKGKLHHG